MPADKSSRPQITTDHGPASRGNVWAAIWHAGRVGSDVAVPSNRDDDPNEWANASRLALENAARCAEQAQRWIAAAQECQVLADALSREDRSE